MRLGGTMMGMGLGEVPWWWWCAVVWSSIASVLEGLGRNETACCGVVVRWVGLFGAFLGQRGLVHARKGGGASTFACISAACLVDCHLQ